MIALIDYGAGNLTSVRKALTALDAPFFTPGDPAELRQAHAVIVPGVGHFDRTRALDASWRDAIGESLQRDRPLFGICVGLQWLFEGSTEAPDVPGFGAFPGVCRRLGEPATDPPLKVPHVGWNHMQLPHETALMRGIADGAQVYFTHSYAAPVVDDTAAVSVHGAPFTAAVSRGRISGVQFHPEKSGDIGLQVLRNWLSTL